MGDLNIDYCVAHVDDADSVTRLLDSLRMLHGSDYYFAVGRWNSRQSLIPPPGSATHRFVVSAQNAAIDLHADEVVRGVPTTGPYIPMDMLHARVSAPHRERLWPGDVICVADGDEQAPVLHGQGTYFDVITERTAYPAPRLAMLRHLPDKPGGCAAYAGAFRREALPPQRPAPDIRDQRGVNRVNEHTLDMRIDRNPPPIRHYHGPIQVAADQVVNHSETAIVLSRAAYGLPEVDQPDQGHVVIYRRPGEDPSDKVVISVRPGSIVVTPATSNMVCGHAFENAFAMLVAIPGFVAPYHHITELSEQQAVYKEVS